jgi:RNA polymerase sigma-70 factor (ECF subfamily)
MQPAGSGVISVSADFVHLIHRARDGDRQALGTLLESFRKDLLHAAERDSDSGLRPKEGASDVVQLTLLEALQQFEQFRGATYGELAAWLRRMLRNNALDMHRRYRYAATRDVRREVPLDGDVQFAQGRHALLRLQPTPSRELMRREEDAELAAAIERLRERQRRVIYLRHEENLTFEEIGSRMGLSAEAARKLWCRAVKCLQVELEGRA